MDWVLVLMIVVGLMMALAVGILIVGLCQAMASDDDAQALAEWEARRSALRKASREP